MNPAKDTYQTRCGRPGAWRLSLRSAVAVSIFMLTACSGSLPESPMAYYTGWSIGDPSHQMLLEGTLEIRDDCLIVDSPESEGYVNLPVFPRHLADWDAHTGILTYNGVECGIGDDVFIGIGSSTTDTIEIPPACAVLGPPVIHLVQDDSLKPLGER